MADLARRATSHGVPIRNMYAKFHNDRLRNG